MLKDAGVSKTTWFQVTLLTVWGASAMAALAVTFWLTRADWVHEFRADGRPAMAQQAESHGLADAQAFRDEMFRLKQAVNRLENQNRILLSRLEIVEDETGEFTAAISSIPDASDRSGRAPHSQRMPETLPNPLPNNKKSVSNGQVFTRIDPYPLKLQGSDRAPTDAEISKALKGQ